MPLTAVCDYIEKPKASLVKSNRWNSAFKDFEEIKSNSERTRFLTKLLKEHNMIVEGTLKTEKTWEKSNEFAESYRQQGNSFYVKRRYLDALGLYNQSLCFAETGSKTMGLAYANRSAVYIELKCYKNCLKSVQLAKENNYPAENYEKLQKRVEVSTAMINDNDNQSPSNIPVGAQYFKLAYKPNEKLPFISDCLEVKTNEVYGRYITTKKALQPGDVVCYEEPFSKMLLPWQRYKYCATCLSDNFLDLIPCEGCTSTMFCSEDCAAIGYEKFHKFECPVIDTLNGLTADYTRHALRNFFEALDVCEGNLNELKTLINKNEDSQKTLFDYEHPDKIENILKAIDSMATNESLRSASEMFERAGIVAITCDLVLKHSSLSDIVASEDDRDFFYSFMLKQCQIQYRGIYNGVLDKRVNLESLQHGTGSYPFSALFNHSCAPNVFPLFLNNKNCMCINRPIAAGEQLFECYGPHHWDRTLAERQADLQSKFKFKCSCEACTKNYPLRCTLKYYTNFRQFLSDDRQKLQQLDVAHAKNKFQSYCNYLKKNNAQYPCDELTTIEMYLMRCLNIFAASEFKLQLCRE